MTDRNDSKDEHYSDEDTERRMKDAIRRALNTPPKPHKEMVGNDKPARASKRSRVTPSRRSKPE
jgi:hypothetical protein